MGDPRSSGISTGNLLESPNLAVYLGVARRRRMWILLSVLGMTTAAAVLAHRLPDIYRAETVILVDPQQVPDKYVPTTVTANIADRLTTLQQQVLSPTRLKKLVESEHLHPDAAGKMTEDDVIKSVQKSITVDVANPGGAKMGAFKITYSSRRRNEVARMANLLAQMFIEENQNARVEQTEETRDFIENQLAETKRQLDEKESLLRAIKTRNILDLPEAKPYHLEALANLRGQVQGIQDKIAQDQREKTVLQSVLASGNAAPTIDVEGDPEAAGETPYRAQIHKLEGKLTELRARYGPSHPEVRKTQDELKRLRARASSEAQNPAAWVDQKPAIQPGAIKRRNPVIEAQIEKLNEDIQEQEKLLPSLQAKMDFHASKLEKMPVFEQQIAGLQRDYDILKTQYTGLLDKKFAAAMSNALEIHQKGERFVVLDAATTPENPAAPNRVLISLAGMMGGLLAGIALAAVVEMNDESVRTENEASSIFGKPVLTGIPYIVSVRERRFRRLRATGLFVGTMVGATALGLALSFVAGRFF